MPIPHWITRVNRVVANPVMGLFSDRVPPLATLHHVGRSSGRRYRTPILAFPTARGFAVALTYGPDVQWLRNLEAGMPARLVRRRRVYALAHPVRHHGEDGLRFVPAWTRAALGLMHVDIVVELDVVDGE